MFKLITVFFLVSLLSSCVTTVDVARVHSTTQPGGIRYSLPAPFLLVTPKSDGTMEAKVVYFPDPDRQYAIQTRSYLNNHTQTVTLDGALLTKFSLKAEEPAVLQSLISSASELEVAKIEAASEEEKKAQEEATAAAKAAQAALGAAKTEVTNLQAEVETLASQLAVVNATPVDDSQTDEFKTLLASKKLALELEIEAKKNALARAQSTLDDQLQTAADNAFRDGSADIAPGPLLFRIVQTQAGVSLKEVSPGQIDLDTYTRPKKKAEQPKEISFSYLTPKDVSRTGDRIVKLKASRILAAYVGPIACPTSVRYLTEVELNQAGAKVGDAVATVLSGGLDLSITLPADDTIGQNFQEADGKIKLGDYSLDIKMKYCLNGSESRFAKSVVVRVRE